MKALAEFGGLLILIVLILSFADRDFWRPFPYLGCNECDGRLEETGWCPTCRKFRPH